MHIVLPRDRSLWISFLMPSTRTWKRGTLHRDRHSDVTSNALFVVHCLHVQKKTREVVKACEIVCVLAAMS